MRFPTDRQDETRVPGIDRTTCRQVFRDAALNLAGASLALVRVGRAENVCRDDLAIDETTALIFSEQAPLQPDRGLKDARAVWCHAPKESERRVLLYFHGHNGYVTVDAQGRSRVPDWAAGQASARAGASAKLAAPLVYGLDRLGTKLKAKEPMVLVPEVSTLATGSFWAKEPAGQYADPREAGRCSSRTAGIIWPAFRDRVAAGTSVPISRKSRSSASISAAILAREFRWKKRPDRR